MKEKIDWDEIARALAVEMGEGLVDPSEDPNDPYNWWLQELTVAELIKFLKTKID